ncbi:Putative Zn-dependent protease, contains TPR repeats [Sulfurivirga caldicuralii]|uniref:Putative Zn-dependent protease, contains TPR repeats n=1 Tax=Sulfurivirga caldicuralii TaxID=364032 RepID=A0A1N6DXA7_9GAMM|nr:M48 family metalloprotease [Sulfurivirga caldicuralii]SIN75390.1 Putative Zn-dependent protease, contains TPR repeats [Sulfurivirga caldicuralii]
MSSWAPAQSASIQLPELGSNQQAAIDQQTEETFRNAFLSSLYTRKSVIEDPLVILWLDRLGQRLALHAPLLRAHIQVLPIASDAINAFAGPGGIIGINRGLLLAANTTDEVAAVIAHEIGHVSQHHLLRRFANADKDNLTAFATMLAALLVGQLDPQAGMATFYAGNAFHLEQQLKFSRHHETEADAVGIQLLAESGFDPTAMAHFFQTLQQRSLNDPSQVPEVLRTHPVTPHRIAAAENRATRFSANLHNVHPILPPLQELKTLLIPNMHRTDRCLARALQDADLSQACRETLQKRAQHDWLVMGILMKWANRHTPQDTAKVIRRKMETHFPNNAALRLIAAQLAFDQGRYKDSERHLRHVDRLAPSALRSLAFQLWARLHKSQHRDDASLLALAQSALLCGNTDKARYLIKQIEPKNLSAEGRSELKSIQASLPNNASGQQTNL